MIYYNAFKFKVVWLHNKHKFALTFVLIYFICLSNFSIIKYETLSINTIDTKLQKVSLFDNLKVTRNKRRALSEQSSNNNKENYNDNPLYHYLANSMYGGTEQIILLQWNSDGILQKVSPIKRKHWFDEKTINILFNKTEPSEYGKLAFVFNTDYIDFIKWHIKPPIPLLVYTIPNDNKHSLYQVIPHVYDRSGYCKYNIRTLQNTIGIETTFEEFIAKESTIIWRGTNHHEPIRELIFNTTIQMLKENITWFDTYDVHLYPAKSMEIEDMSLNYKYQLDVGGVSGTSWCGLRWKMCASNSVVFKINSSSKDWWYEDIHPWKHYIPIKDDLSDLQEQYKWAEENPEIVYKIMLDGKEACLQSSDKYIAQEKQIEIIKSLPPASGEMINYAHDMFEHHLDRLFMDKDPIIYNDKK